MMFFSPIQPPSVGAVTKALFFDRAGVRAAIDRRCYRVLLRAGAWCRSLARQSIRRVGHARKEPKKYSNSGRLTKAWLRWWEEVKRRPASRAPNPPHTHSGLLRESIMYGYDAGRQSVVVGPLGSKTADFASLHEFGGVRFGRHYPARPYMQPARDRTIEQLPRFFAEAAN